MLRVLGENLRTVLGRSFNNRAGAFAAGIGVTSLVQSSTATCLILASFAGKGLVLGNPSANDLHLKTTHTLPLPPEMTWKNASP
jgi:Na+/phosphate symporter